MDASLTDYILPRPMMQAIYPKWSLPDSTLGDDITRKSLLMGYESSEDDAKVQMRKILGGKTSFIIRLK